MAQKERITVVVTAAGFKETGELPIVGKTFSGKEIKVERGGKGVRLSVGTESGSTLAVPGNGLSVSNVWVTIR